MANFIAVAIGIETGQSVLASAQDGATAYQRAALSMDEHNADTVHREFSSQESIHGQTTEVVNGSHASDIKKANNAISTLANVVTSF